MTRQSSQRMGRSSKRKVAGSTERVVRATSQEVILEETLAQLLGVDALDLGSLHVLAKLWLATNEAVVEVSSLVRSLSDAVKTPHVELSLETLVLGLVEVFGHDFFIELFGLVYLEAVFGGNPRDDVVESLGIGVVEDAVKLPWEGNGSGWLSAWQACSLGLLGEAVVAIVESCLVKIAAEASLS